MSNLLYDTWVNDATTILVKCEDNVVKTVPIKTMFDAACSTIKRKGYDLSNVPENLRNDVDAILDNSTKRNELTTEFLDVTFLTMDANPGQCPGSSIQILNKIWVNLQRKSGTQPGIFKGALVLGNMKTPLNIFEPKAMS